MRKGFIGKQKKVLEAKRAELQTALRKRQDIQIEKAPDELDELQQASDRDLAITTIDQFSRQLAAVRAALRRADDGEYGICINCDREISDKRLEAVPWTPYCVSCQEAADSGEDVADVKFEGGESPLSEAAA